MVPPEAWYRERQCRKQSAVSSFL